MQQPKDRKHQRYLMGAMVLLAITLFFCEDFILLLTGTHILWRTTFAQAVYLPAVFLYWLISAGSTAAIMTPSAWGFPSLPVHLQLSKWQSLWLKALPHMRSIVC